MNLDFNIKEAIKRGNVKSVASILEKYALKNERNTDLLLRLAITVLNMPLLDVEKSLACLGKIQSGSSDYIKAKLIECCIYKQYLGGIGKDLYNDLCNLSSENLEDMAMIEFVKSWRYSTKDTEKCISILQKSVGFCGNLVWNCVELGKLLIKFGEKENGLKMMYDGLNNIRHIFSNYEKVDFTNYHVYIDEHIKGTYITIINLQSVIQSIINNQFS